MSQISGQHAQGQEPFAALRGLAANPAASANALPTQQVTAQVARARRTRRPLELVNAIRQMDTQTDPAAITQWLAWINEQYQVSDCGLLLGLFSHCYLGERYIDHLLDMSQNILVHYNPESTVPPGFEPARPLARSTAYAYIEVYTDGTVIPIYKDGKAG